MVLGRYKQEQRRHAFHPKRQMQRPNEPRHDKEEGQT
jgi:hypothetical protein